MHCIEIKANVFSKFKQEVRKHGGDVSIVSRYQDRGVRILDVEVSTDTRNIDRLEGVYGYFA